MGGPRDHHTYEVRQTQILYDITYRQTLNMMQMNLYTKQKQTHGNRKQIYGWQRVEGMRDKLGVWD